MLKNKKLMSMTLLMVLFVSLSVSSDSFAEKIIEFRRSDSGKFTEYIYDPYNDPIIRDVEHDIKPQAILCGKCNKGYLVDREQIDERTFNRNGRHSRVDGVKCTNNYSHVEYVTYTTRFSKCPYCGFGIEYTTTTKSVCR